MRTLKGLLIDGLETSGANALLRRWYSGAGVVFLLHRVLAPGTRTTVPGNAVTTDFLDAVIAYVRRAGWEIVHLSEAVRRLRNGPDREPFACFTFDDGFRDNLALALPVFRLHGAPLSVFICTGFVDHRSVGGAAAVSRVLPVGYLLAEYVSLHPGLEGERVKAGLGRGSADAIYRRLLRLQRQNVDRFDDAIDRLVGALGRDRHEVLDEIFLDWEAARELAMDRLVEIGGHSVTHARLATLSPEACRWELAESRATLERELRVPVRHFAYPYGGPLECGPREFAMAHEAGYHASLTTRAGNLFPEHADRLQALPRVVLSMVPHAGTIRFVKAALYGSRNALMNRLSRFARE